MRQQQSSVSSVQQQQRQSSLRQESRQSQQVSSSSQLSSSRAESRRRIEDDVSYKIADVRMSPWSRGQELDEANAASARARSRILELERELEEITRKAMTTQARAMKTAKQMAMEATREDEANVQNSFTKSKKVMIESSSRIN